MADCHFALDISMAHCHTPSQRTTPVRKGAPEMAKSPRSEICKNCCPSGGALFDVVLNPAWISNEEGGDYMPVYVKPGELMWSDAQFLLLDDDGEEMDSYSDSMMCLPFPIIGDGVMNKIVLSRPPQQSTLTPTERATIASQRVTVLGNRVRELERDIDDGLDDLRGCHGAQRSRGRLIVRAQITMLRRERTDYTVAWLEYSMAVAVRDARYVLTQAAE